MRGVCHYERSDAISLKFSWHVLKKLIAFAVAVNITNGVKLANLLDRLELMLSAIQPVLTAIGAVVAAGGGLTVIVYMAFKHLAAKWLESQFDARLQELKHQHDEELEQLRFKIAALLDRTTKLHQREFETMPEAWAKLNDAFWQTYSTVSSVQQYPDIDSMTPPHQAEFIEGCKLQNWEKDELKRTNKKTDYYQSHIRLYHLSEAQNKSRDAHVFLLKNGIFFSEEIRKAFQEIDDLVWDAIVEHEFNVRNNIIPMQRKKIGALTEKGEQLLRGVEEKVRRRLWPKDNIGL